jgi:hypothetical protein
VLVEHDPHLLFATRGFKWQLPGLERVVLPSFFP